MRSRNSTPGRGWRGRGRGVRSSSLDLLRRNKSGSSPMRGWRGRGRGGRSASLELLRRNRSRSLRESGLRNLTGVGSTSRDSDSSRSRSRSRGRGPGNRGQGHSTKGKNQDAKEFSNRGRGSLRKDILSDIRDRGSGSRGRGSGSRGRGSGSRGRGSGSRGRGARSRGQGSGNRGRGSGSRGRGNVKIGRQSKDSNQEIENGKESKQTRVESEGDSDTLTEKLETANVSALPQTSAQRSETRGRFPRSRGRMRGRGSMFGGRRFVGNGRFTQGVQRHIGYKRGNSKAREQKPNSSRGRSRDRKNPPNAVQQNENSQPEEHAISAPSVITQPLDPSFYGSGIQNDQANMEVKPRKSEGACISPEAQETSSLGTVKLKAQKKTVKQPENATPASLSAKSTNTCIQQKSINHSGLKKVQRTDTTAAVQKPAVGDIHPNQGRNLFEHFQTDCLSSDKNDADEEAHAEELFAASAASAEDEKLPHTCSSKDTIKANLKSIKRKRKKNRSKNIDILRNEANKFMKGKIIEFKEQEAGHAIDHHQNKTKSVALAGQKPKRVLHWLKGKNRGFSWTKKKRRSQQVANVEKVEVTDGQSSGSTTDKDMTRNEVTPQTPVTSATVAHSRRVTPETPVLSSDTSSSVSNSRGKFTSRLHRGRGVARGRSKFKGPPSRNTAAVVSDDDRTRGFGNKARGKISARGLRGKKGPSRGIRKKSNLSRQQGSGEEVTSLEAHESEEPLLMCQIDSFTIGDSIETDNMSGFKILSDFENQEIILHKEQKPLNDIEPSKSTDGAKKSAASTDSIQALAVTDSSQSTKSKVLTDGTTDSVVAKPKRKGGWPKGKKRGPRKPKFQEPSQVRCDDKRQVRIFLKRIDQMLVYEKYCGFKKQTARKSMKDQSILTDEVRNISQTYKTVEKEQLHTHGHFPSQMHNNKETTQNQVKPSSSNDNLSKEEILSLVMKETSDISENLTTHSDFHMTCKDKETMFIDDINRSPSAIDHSYALGTEGVRTFTLDVREASCIPAGKRQMVVPETEDVEDIYEDSTVDNVIHGLEEPLKPKFEIQSDNFETVVSSTSVISDSKIVSEAEIENLTLDNDTSGNAQSFKLKETDDLFMGITPQYDTINNPEIKSEESEEEEEESSVNVLDNPHDHEGGHSIIPGCPTAKLSKDDKEMGDIPVSHEQRSEIVQHSIRKSALTYFNLTETDATDSTETLTNEEIKQENETPATGGDTKPNKSNDGNGADNLVLNDEPVFSQIASDKSHFIETETLKVKPSHSEIEASEDHKEKVDKTNTNDSACEILPPPSSIEKPTFSVKTEDTSISAKVSQSGTGTTPGIGKTIEAVTTAEQHVTSNNSIVNTTDREQNGASEFAVDISEGSTEISVCLAEESNSVIDQDIALADHALTNDNSNVKCNNEPPETDNNTHGSSNYAHSEAKKKQTNESISVESTILTRAPFKQSGRLQDDKALQNEHKAGYTETASGTGESSSAAPVANSKRINNKCQPKTLAHLAQEVVQSFSLLRQESTSSRDTQGGHSQRVLNKIQSAAQLDYSSSPCYIRPPLCHKSCFTSAIKVTEHKIDNETEPEVGNDHSKLDRAGTEELTEKECTSLIIPNSSGIETGTGSNEKHASLTQVNNEIHKDDESQNMNARNTCVNEEKTYNEGDTRSLPEIEPKSVSVSTVSDTEKNTPSPDQEKETEKNMSKQQNTSMIGNASAEIKCERESHDTGAGPSDRNESCDYISVNMLSSPASPPRSNHAVPHEPIAIPVNILDSEVLICKPDIPESPIEDVPQQGVEKDSLRDESEVKSRAVSVEGHRGGTATVVKESTASDCDCDQPSIKSGTLFSPVTIKNVNHSSRNEMAISKEGVVNSESERHDTSKPSGQLGGIENTTEIDQSDFMFWECSSDYGEALPIDMTRFEKAKIAEMLVHEREQNSEGKTMARCEENIEVDIKQTLSGIISCVCHDEKKATTENIPVEEAGKSEIRAGGHIEIEKCHDSTGSNSNSFSQQTGIMTDLTGNSFSSGDDKTIEENASATLSEQINANFPSCSTEAEELGDGCREVGSAVPENVPGPEKELDDKNTCADLDKPVIKLPQSRITDVQDMFADIAYTEDQRTGEGLNQKGKEQTDISLKYIGNSDIPAKQTTSSPLYEHLDAGSEETSEVNTTAFPETYGSRARNAESCENSEIISEAPSCSREMHTSTECNNIDTETAADILKEKTLGNTAITPVPQDQIIDHHAIENNTESETVCPERIEKCTSAGNYDDDAVTSDIQAILAESFAGPVTNTTIKMNDSFEKQVVDNTVEPVKEMDKDSENTCKQLQFDTKTAIEGGANSTETKEMHACSTQDSFLPLNSCIIHTGNSLESRQTTADAFNQVELVTGMNQSCTANERESRAETIKHDSDVEKVNHQPELNDSAEPEGQSGHENLSETQAGSELHRRSENLDPTTVDKQICLVGNMNGKGDIETGHGDKIYPVVSTGDIFAPDETEIEQTLSGEAVALVETNYQKHFSFDDSKPDQVNSSDSAGMTFRDTESVPGNCDGDSTKSSPNVLSHITSENRMDYPPAPILSEKDERITDTASEDQDRDALPIDIHQPDKQISQVTISALGDYVNERAERNLPNSSALCGIENETKNIESGYHQFGPHLSSPYTITESEIVMKKDERSGEKGTPSANVDVFDIDATVPIREECQLNSRTLQQGEEETNGAQNVTPNANHDEKCNSSSTLNTLDLSQTFKDVRNHPVSDDDPQNIDLSKQGSCETTDHINIEQNTMPVENGSSPSNQNAVSKMDTIFDGENQVVIGEQAQVDVPKRREQPPWLKNCKKRKRKGKWSRQKRRIAGRVNQIPIIAPDFDYMEHDLPKDGKQLGRIVENTEHQLISSNEKGIEKNANERGLSRQDISSNEFPPVLASIADQSSSNQSRSATFGVGSTTDAEIYLHPLPTKKKRRKKGIVKVKQQKALVGQEEGILSQNEGSTSDDTRRAPRLIVRRKRNLTDESAKMKTRGKQNRFWYVYAKQSRLSKLQNEAAGLTQEPEGQNITPARSMTVGLVDVLKYLGIDKMLPPRSTPPDEAMNLKDRPGTSTEPNSEPYPSVNNPAAPKKMKGFRRKRRANVDQTLPSAQEGKRRKRKRRSSSSIIPLPDAALQWQPKRTARKSTHLSRVLPNNGQSKITDGNDGTLAPTSTVNVFCKAADTCTDSAGVPGTLDDPTSAGTVNPEPAENVNSLSSKRQQNSANEQVTGQNGDIAKVEKIVIPADNGNKINREKKRTARKSTGGPGRKRKIKLPKEDEIINDAVATFQNKGQKLKGKRKYNRNAQSVKDNKFETGEGPATGVQEKVKAEMLSEDQSQTKSPKDEVTNNSGKEPQENAKPCPLSPGNLPPITSTHGEQRRPKVIKKRRRRKNRLGIKYKKHTVKRPLPENVVPVEKPVETPSKVIAAEQLIIKRKRKLVEKTYHCMLCTYQSRGQNAVVEHIYGHTNHIPYECAICSARFSTKGAGYYHHRRYHPGTSPNIKKHELLKESDFYRIERKFIKPSSGKGEPGEPPSKGKSKRSKGSDKPGDNLKKDSKESSEKTTPNNVPTMSTNTTNDVTPLSMSEMLSCQLCSFTAVNRDIMNIHISKVHASQQTYTCPNCGKSMNEDFAIREHQATCYPANVVQSIPEAMGPLTVPVQQPAQIESQFALPKILQGGGVIQLPTSLPNCPVVINQQVVPSSVSVTPQATPLQIASAPSAITNPVPYIAPNNLINSAYSAGYATAQNLIQANAAGPVSPQMFPGYVVCGMLPVAQSQSLAGNQNSEGTNEQVIQQYQIQNASESGLLTSSGAVNTELLTCNVSAPVNEQTGVKEANYETEKAQDGVPELKIVSVCSLTPGEFAERDAQTPSESIQTEAERSFVPNTEQRPSSKSSIELQHNSPVTPFIPDGSTAAENTMYQSQECGQPSLRTEEPTPNPSYAGPVFSEADLTSGGSGAIFDAERIQNMPYRCDQCPLGFKDPQEYITHLTTGHVPNLNTPEDLSSDNDGSISSSTNTCSEALQQLATNSSNRKRENFEPNQAVITQKAVSPINPHTSQKKKRARLESITSRLLTDHTVIKSSSPSETGGIADPPQPRFMTRHVQSAPQVTQRVHYASDWKYPKTFADNYTRGFNQGNPDNLKPVGPTVAAVSPTRKISENPVTIQARPATTNTEQGDVNFREQKFSMIRSQLAGPPAISSVFSAFSAGQRGPPPLVAVARTVTPGGEIRKVGEVPPLRRQNNPQALQADYRTSADIQMASSGPAAIPGVQQPSTMSMSAGARQGPPPYPPPPYSMATAEASKSPIPRRPIPMAHSGSPKTLPPQFMQIPQPLSVSSVPQNLVAKKASASSSPVVHAQAPLSNHGNAQALKASGMTYQYQDTTHAGPYQCPYCLIQSHDHRFIQNHMLSHTNIMDTCPYCPGSYKLPRHLLASHIDKKHPGFPIPYTKAMT